ncbi:MAG: cobalamin B12-binding domain-containing protein [Candidatus Omnitrophica bacterium]|nr:cobalamin B12-binding domain-containing protein [Candidatus Omnitrophota bacterium]
MSERLQVAIVNPGDRLQVYQALGGELAAIEPPVWAGLTATYLRQKGFSVEILDANALGLSPEETAQRVKEMNPLLTAVVVYGHQPSASTQTMPSCGAVCRAIKKLDPSLTTILVGGHVAALPERTLTEEACDFVAGGEGPVTVGDLAQALASQRPEDLTKVRGLYYRVNGGAASNPPAPLIQDLDDEMPQMAWDLLPMDRYRAHNWHCFDGLRRQPYASIYTTLGCPYHCSFCCIQAPFKVGEKLQGLKEAVNSYRYFHPRRVVDQLEYLVVKHGVRNVKFADEMFVLNPSHVLAICDGIIARGLDLNIWAYARVDTIRDAAVLEKLKRAGVNWLAFGIEAANERVRDGVKKGFVQGQIFKALDKVRQAGIYVIGNYIFGLPDDDHETMQETLQMAQDLNCEFANFYAAMAYPGSALYRQALAEGWSLPESWSGYSQHAFDTLPLPTKHLSAGEVLAFRDQAFNTYFASPGYLRMVGEKFGAETVRHIQAMAKVRLNRKIVSQPHSLGVAE